MASDELFNLPEPPFSHLETMDSETHFWDFEDSVRKVKGLTQCLAPCELTINLGVYEFSKAYRFGGTKLTVTGSQTPEPRL